MIYHLDNTILLNNIELNYINRSNLEITINKN